MEGSKTKLRTSCDSLTPSLPSPSDNSLIQVKARALQKDESTGLWKQLKGNPVTIVNLRKDGENEYSITGHTLLEHQELFNCKLNPNTQYQRGDATFHHWNIDNQRHGLTFLHMGDAKRFERLVRKAIDEISPPTGSVGEEEIFMKTDEMILDCGSSAVVGQVPLRPHKPKRLTEEYRVSDSKDKHKNSSSSSDEENKSPHCTPSSTCTHTTTSTAAPSSTCTHTTTSTAAPSSTCTHTTTSTAAPSSTCTHTTTSTAAVSETLTLGANNSNLQNRSTCLDAAVCCASHPLTVHLTQPTLKSSQESMNLVVKTPSVETDCEPLLKKGADIHTTDKKVCTATSGSATLAERSSRADRVNSNIYVVQVGSTSFQTAPLPPRTSSASSVKPSTLPVVPRRDQYSDYRNDYYIKQEQKKSVDKTKTVTVSSSAADAVPLRRDSDEFNDFNLKAIKNTPPLPRKKKRHRQGMQLCCFKSEHSSDET